MVISLFAACGSSRTAAPVPAAASSESGYPAYLNLDGPVPVIKEGEGAGVTVTMVTGQGEMTLSWENLWLAKYIERFMNIDMKVEQILTSALSERKNLMFAADDLPDILFNVDLTSNEIMRYGQMEGQLLDLTPYVNGTLTPETVYNMDKYPDSRTMCTTPDGKMYTLPFVNEPDDDGSADRTFLDKRWLDACGIENPRTLDDFIDMLRLFKEKDVTGVGADNIVPYAVSFNYLDPSWYFLNALGYVGGGRGTSPALRDGEPELPVTNAEVYLEFIKVMKTLYDEKLFSENYFTAEGTEVNAWLLENRAGVFSEPVYVTGYTEWREWDSVYPLTSDWNATPKWAAPISHQVGDFAMSANSKYPEIGVRFANVFFAPFGRIFMLGPAENMEERMDHIGSSWNPETQTVVFNEHLLPEGINDPWTYLLMYQTWYFTLGTWCLRESNAYIGRLLGGNPPPGKNYNLDDADEQYMSLVAKNLMPYAVERFPYIYYLEEESTIRLSDLSAVIDSYLNEQIASFMTGRRPLSEYDAFIAEMKSIGIDELDQIYKNVWAEYKKAK